MAYVHEVLVVDVAKTQAELVEFDHAEALAEDEQRSECAFLDWYLPEEKPVYCNGCGDTYTGEYCPTCDFP